MNILIVEDHESVAAGIAHSLRDEGYQVSICDSALAAIDLLAGARFDLLILDINLKLSSGLDVLQHARTKRLPLAIIILSARNTVDQRIAALDLGADDYLSKPFVMSELLARVRVQARRVAPTAQPEETIGRLTYSPSMRSVRISETDESIKLTKKELAVFECLLAHKGMLVSKSTLASHLYGDDADIEEAVVEIYISRLRKQVEGMAIEIKTARGLGYLMTPAS